MKKLLSPGDTVSTTLSLSMPVGDERGDPWVKAEITNTTTIRPKESYKGAVKRSQSDAQRRLDRQINWLFRSVTGKPKKRKSKHE